MVFSKIHREPLYILAIDFDLIMWKPLALSAGFVDHHCGLNVVQGLQSHREDVQYCNVSWERRTTYSSATKRVIIKLGKPSLVFYELWYVC